MACRREPVIPATAASVYCSGRRLSSVGRRNRLWVVLRNMQPAGSPADDHLLTGRRGLRLDFLLRRGLEVTHRWLLSQRWMLANTAVDPTEVQAEPGRRIQPGGHLLHDLRKGQSHSSVRSCPSRRRAALCLSGSRGSSRTGQRLHAGGILRAGGIAGAGPDRGRWGEQAVESSGSRPDRTGEPGGSQIPACTSIVPKGQTDPDQYQCRADDEGELPHVQTTVRA